MAVALNDIIQIEDYQTYLGQVLLNVYHYQVTELGTGNDLQQFIDNWQTQVRDVVRTIQSSLCVHTGTVAKNLSNGVDITVEPTNVTGGGGDVGAPSFEAASFRLVRSTLATRHGSKRIGGLLDDMSEDNSLKATYATAIANVEVALGTDVSQDSGAADDYVMVPVIVGRFHLGNPNVGELDLSTINPVSAAQFIRISTQVTRRAGRGI